VPGGSAVSGHGRGTVRVYPERRAGLIMEIRPRLANLPHPAIVCSGPQLDSVIRDLEAGTCPQPEDAVWRDDLPREQAIRLARATGATDEQIAEIAGGALSAAPVDTAPDAGEAVVPCPTCEGQGVTMMRGDSHRTYDDPDYMDTCVICGGARVLPASMFSEIEADDYEDDDGGE
jgi:hypothetical protein